MKTKEIDFQILGILRRQCDPQTGACLMKEFRRAQSVDEELATRSRDGKAGDEKGYVSLREKLDQFVTLCSTRLTGDQLLRVILEVGEMFKVNGDLQRAEEMFTQVLENKNDQERCLAAEACIRRAEIYSRHGRWKQSSTDLNRSRRWFREMGKESDIARVENIIGTNLVEQGSLKKAQTQFRKALRIFCSLKEKEMEGSVLMNMGIVHNIIGQYDQALTHYHRARSSFEEIGDLPRLAMLHHNMAMTYLHKGIYKEAVRMFENSFRIGVKVKDLNLIGLSCLGRANASYHLGDLPFSLELVNQALHHLESSSDRLSIADAYKVKGMIHRGLNRFDAAALYLQTSLRINNEFHNPLNKGETYYQLGLLEESRGRSTTAREHFENALSCFKTVGAMADVSRVETHLGRNGEEN